MKRAACAVKQILDSYPLDDVSATLKALGYTLRHELGGSSGPLYGVLFLRAGSELESTGGTDISQWARAIDEGARAISTLGGAKLGDRTMMDALYPFVAALYAAAPNSSRRDALLAAVKAAHRGAESTAQMIPRLGRSSYLRDRVLGHPDPGAIALTIWLGAVSDALVGPATTF